MDGAASLRTVKQEYGVLPSIQGLKSTFAVSYAAYPLKRRLLFYHQKAPSFASQSCHYLNQMSLRKHYHFYMNRVSLLIKISTYSTIRFWLRTRKNAGCFWRRFLQKRRLISLTYSTGWVLK